MRVRTRKFRTRSSITSGRFPSDGLTGASWRACGVEFLMIYNLPLHSNKTTNKIGRKFKRESNTVFKSIQVSFDLLQFPEELLWPCQNPHRVLKIFIYCICSLKSKETNKYKIKILYQHHQLAVPQELLHTDILKGCRQLPCPLNLKQR